MTTKQDAVVNDTSGAILGLLTVEGSMCGNDLVTVADKWVAPYFPLTRSQVYRELKAMEQRGLVREGKRIPKGGLEYRITAAGKKALNDWYNSAYKLDTIRNSMALRVALAQVTGKANLEAVVFNAIKAHEEEVERLNGLIEEGTKKELVSDVVALEFALNYHLMAVGWLKTVKF